MQGIITEEKLEKYFSVTKEAIDKIKERGIDEERKKEAEDFLDMATRYYQDAIHFKEKGDVVTAFAALNYAHGWLDAGARLKLFNVEGETHLFTVD